MDFTNHNEACKKINTWPNCGPNGGEAEAFPAGIYVRNLPIIFPDFFAALADILKIPSNLVPRVFLSLCRATRVCDKYVENSKILGTIEL